MRSKLALAGAALMGALLAAPAQAQERAPTPDMEEAERLAREAIESLLRMLETLMESIPQYEAPIINEDGDIIIRRRHPRREREAPPQGEPDQTQT